MGVDESYLVERLLNALLREDFAGLASQGEVQRLPDGPWLRYRDGERIWWVPVAGDHLGPWRVRAAFLEEERGGRRRRLCATAELVERMLPQVDFKDELRQEVGCALEHDRLCRNERARWFSSSGQRTPEGMSWVESLAFYDRLASFHDHPYYPTARAKVGFDEAALRRWAPEWAPQFELLWAAVPDERFTVREGTLPSWWPSAPPGHTMVPVHPHTWDAVGWPEAPRRELGVTPTLSVRTVACVEHPDTHLKIPLAMRSLSFKNIRRIKPGTIIDGDRVQCLLRSIVSDDPDLAGTALFTDEGTGLSVDDRADLGCIVRRYPSEQLEGCIVLPTAALLAPTPEGVVVLEALVKSHFGGDALRFYRAYVGLTLRFHLTLWCRYGIALESNQQNTLLVLGGTQGDGALRLLLKDDDAARILRSFTRTRVRRAELLDQLVDPCIPVDDWADVARLFTVITLHLNLLPFLEHAPRLGVSRAAAYALCRELFEEALAGLDPVDVARSQVRELVLDADFHPVKYLFSSGTLFSKERTGAADINKHYGLSAPNCFR